MPTKEQKEIWDDTLLISAWDSAVQEFQKYHSKDALKASTTISGNTNGASSTTLPILETHAGLEMRDAKVTEESGANDTEMEEGQVEESDRAHSDQSQTTEPKTASHRPEPGPHHLSELDDPSNFRALPATIPKIPAPPLAMFKNDETMKNLLMSWYYAGYYTGLHEASHKQTIL